MPIKVQGDLPAKAILGEGNIFIMDEGRVTSQDIHPLEVLILDLMPLKEETETQLMQTLPNIPLQMDCTFLMLSTHMPKNASTSHLNEFCATFDEIKKKRYDGMIITEAPVENLEYEEVNYWPGLSMMMEWNRTHVTSTIHTCWGAQAGLYYHYGTPKCPMKKKLLGIYSHRVLDQKVLLVRSLNDFFLASYSRCTRVRKANILEHPGPAILTESDEAGTFLVMSRDDRQVLVQGHPGYDRVTLNNEYRGDLNKGLDPEVPYNYYEDNDPFLVPSLTWRNISNTLYTSWLDYYMYQATPYLLDVEG